MDLNKIGNQIDDKVEEVAKKNNIEKVAVWFAIFVLVAVVLHAAGVI